MPSFWTHFAFALECKSVPPSSEIVEAIACHPHAFHVGMQGPDMFLFYPPTALRKQRLSTLLHEGSPVRLLTCLWRQAMSAKADDRPIALAYAAGFLGHYCLDSETHPFVYAFSGIERSAQCYTAHNAIEADLNRLIIERVLGKALDELALPDVYRLPPEERRVVARMLSRVVECAYGLECSPHTVSHALSSVRFCAHLLADRTGRKAKFTRILEAPLRLPYLSPLFLGMSHFYPDAANLAHKPWRDPYTGTLSNADFFALYDAAKRRFAHALSLLPCIFPSAYSAFFKQFCRRDFHGAPCAESIDSART